MLVYLVHAQCVISRTANESNGSVLPLRGVLTHFHVSCVGEEDVLTLRYLLISN